MFNYKVSIIGSGLAAILTAIALYRKNKFIKIELFERYNDLTLKGLAYSSLLPYQPLNVTASKMSLLHDDNNHFIDWLYDYYAEKYPKSDLSSSFQPRYVYALYCKDTINKIVESISIVHEEVVDIDDFGITQVLTLSSGKKIETNYVILATGNAHAPTLLGIDDYNGKVITNLVGLSIESVKKYHHLLIVGSGLTAVDIIGSLCKIDYAGKITLISRKGLLPMVHKTNPNANIDINIEELLAIKPASLYQYFSFIKTYLRNNATVDWRDLVDSIRVYVPTLWQNLNPKDKKLFIVRFKSYWEVHRHRMPEQSANIIANLKDRGVLKVLKATIKNAKADSVFLSNGEEIQPDCIINCTGQVTDIIKHSALLKNMLAKKLLVRDDLKLGALLKNTGEIINGQVENSSNIFALGALRRADDYETIAARELKLHSLTIAQEIIYRIYIQSLVNADSYKDFVATAHCFSSDFYISMLPKEAFVPNQYTRIVLYNKKYTILCLVWSPNVKTSIHDHANSSATIKVLQGKLKERKYSVGNKFHCDCEMIYTKNDVFYELADDIHSIQNLSNSYSITLHIYNTIKPTLGGVRIFDEVNNKIGYLNDDAKTSSWLEPITSFTKITPIK